MGGIKLHIALAMLYGISVWLSALAYSFEVQPDVFLVVLVCGPFIVSGLALFLILADIIRDSLKQAIRDRLTRE